MKLVYVAMPYRSTCEDGVFVNICIARSTARDVWKAGGAAICPHLNTAFMGGVVDDATFLAADLLILAKCDAVFAGYRWEASEGARAEVAEAKRLGIPVFDDVEDLRAWIRGGA